MTKVNSWQLDLTKQVNIIVGAELGKTSLLKEIYFSHMNARRDDYEELDNYDSKLNGKYGVGIVYSYSLDNCKSIGEGQARLDTFNYILDKVMKYDGHQLLIIDNPERGLHVSVQQTLISDLLAKGGSNLKLVMATHSPSIILSWLDCVVNANV